jgi:hypothetical protein
MDMVTFKAVRMSRNSEQGWTVMRSGPEDIPTMIGFYPSEAAATIEAERLNNLEPVRKD